MKKKNTLSFEELLEITSKLSKSDIRKIITNYINENDSQPDKRLEKLVTTDLQERIKELKINDCCPKCGSRIITKNGCRSNGVQRLICKDCGNSFTYFTGTMLEKSKLHWDLIVEIIFLMLSHTSIENIKQVLEKDLHCNGIHHETIFHWRHKIFEAATKVPLPTLDSIVEIDETYIREGQKGSLELIDPFNNKTHRLPRKTGSSAKYGVMGPEFGNIICAVDQNNHVVAKYIGVGACKEEVFEYEFDKYISNATWLCTDANVIYQKYAFEKDIRHYVRPSNYLTNLEQGKADGLTEEGMYKLEMLDYIDNSRINRKRMSFKNFKQMKEKYKLGLGHVNAFHDKLKYNIVKTTRGISLVNIDGYVAWECLLQNYTVDNGHQPASRKDAENILIMLLKTKVNTSVKEIDSRKPDFSNVSHSYKKNIVRVTNKMREKEGKETFSFSSEEVGPNFNKRKFIDNLPIYMLRYLCKYCGIKGFGQIKKGHTYKYIKQLENHPKLSEAIYELRATYPNKDTKAS